MLMVIMLRSPPYIRSARVSAVSVLPTPLGPTSRNTPMGLLGSSRLAFDVRMRSLIMASAWSCPMTRRPRCFSSLSTVATSSFSILPTGMPVQAETTSPTMVRVHADAHQRRLTLQLLQLGVRARPTGCAIPRDLPPEGRPARRRQAGRWHAASACAALSAAAACPAAAAAAAVDAPGVDMAAVNAAAACAAAACAAATSRGSSLCRGGPLGGSLCGGGLRGLLLR